ncbi:hypothetical protein [Vibrio profundi]|uniref:hypothetical protein n=1 Tax=Vibrio profundi TaxID=1774960 RepID=UPI0037358E6E
MSIKALQRAADEITLFNEQITVIQSLHKIITRSIDWEELANVPAPTMPTISFANKSKALSELNCLQLTWLDKWTDNSTKLEALVRNIETSANKDIDNYQSALSTWEEAYAQWLTDNKLSKNVLNNDNDSKLEALNRLLPESNQQTVLGSSVIVPKHCEYKNGYNLEITVQIDKDKVVPLTKKTLFQGELVSEHLPLKERNRIYREYVNSCALKTALDAFSILPDKHVKVNVQEAARNESGQIIFTAHFEKTLLDSLDLEYEPASNLVSHFIHFEHFDESKPEGFSPINAPYAPSAEFLTYLF